jgi:hypothetical protein
MPNQTWKWKALGLVVLAAVFSAIVAGRSALGHTAGDQAESMQSPQQVDPYRAGASPLRESQKNDRQVGESSHFDFPVNANHPDLLAQATGGRDSGSLVMDEVGMFQASEPPAEPPGVTLAKRSDLIVRGTVADRQSFLNTSKTVVFTEHDIVIAEVLKNDPASPVSVGSHVFFARRGGSIRVGNNFIFCEYSSMRLPQKGEGILLFLRPIRTAPGAYEGHSFLVRDQGLQSCDGVDEFGGDLADARSEIDMAVRGGKR